MPVCTKCDLHRTCKSVCIQGYGPSQSPRLLLVGRDPGEEEDTIGRPFVGRSGKDLKKALEAIGFKVDECRFTNTVRCHTPNNVGPTPEQVETCLPYLWEEIQSCSPQGIICLGREASQAVLRTTEKMVSLRGRPHHVALEGNTYPVICTHHPGRLYRQPSLVPEFASDLQIMWDLLEGALVGEADLAVLNLETPSEIDPVLDYLEQTGLPFSFDLETVNTYPYLSNSRVLCLGFSFDPDFAYCIPVLYGLEGDATPIGDEATLARYEAILPRIQRLLSLPNPKAGHNVAFDYLWCKLHLGIEPECLQDDTILLHYLLDERVGTHSLDKLAARVGMAGYDNLMVPYYDHPFSEAPWSTLSRYNGLDCIATFRLWKEMGPKVLGDKHLGWVYENLLRPSITKLTKVTENGIAVDGAVVDQVAQELQIQLDSLSQQIDLLAAETPFQERYRKEVERRREISAEKARAKQKAAFEAWTTSGKDPDRFRWKKASKVKDEEVVFMASSPQRLVFMLFEVLKLPVQSRTKKTKSPSTEEEALQALSSLHPLPALILEHRGMAKALNTYVAMLREFTVDGLIHPGFRMHTTVTGRSSSSDPPLQNFPVQSPLRKAFVSRFGPQGILVESDQSQMELRVMAALSGDETLMSAYCSTPPIDVHRLTASKVFKVPLYDTKVDSAQEVLDRFHIVLTLAQNAWRGCLEAGKDPKVEPLLSLPPEFRSHYFFDEHFDLYQKGVTKSQRSSAKTVNFSILYLTSSKSLAGQLKCKEYEAERIIQSYFAGYPGVDRYIKTVIRKAHKDKQLVSTFGRIRRLPEIDSSEPSVVAEAERQAVNYTIQSPASDITILAYYRLYDWLRENHQYKTCVWNLVHDAILQDSPIEEWLPVTKRVAYEMEKTIPWMNGVPLLADSSIGSNWKECKDEANTVTDLVHAE